MVIDRVKNLLTVTRDLSPEQLTENRQKAKDKLQSTVQKRNRELARCNLQLSLEIEERKRAEVSLQGAFSEIKRQKDRLQAENIYLQQEAAQQYNFGELDGQSVALARVLLRVEQVATMNATVLLLGETGTGKGVVAHAIHNSSARRDRPLITVDLTALPENLIESELFGWERGDFTGAESRQIGRFELANHGIVFLDEVCALPLELQGKLLRVIQDGELERLGSPRTVKIDVQIIAGSSRNLEQEVRRGRFREDLFYRLNVFPIVIPPLRQRAEDIPLLVSHFLAKYSKKWDQTPEGVSEETLNALQSYDWPGNVRELESVIERAVIISQEAALRMLNRTATLGRSAASLLSEGVERPVGMKQALGQTG